MFKFVVLSLLVACISADIDSVITRFNTQAEVDGSYSYDIAQSNGAEIKESGIGGQYATGSYQYLSPEGEPVVVAYTADALGFHPISDYLPTPPPVPEYILKSLEFIRNHPTPEEQADQLVRAQQV